MANSRISSSFPHFHFVRKTFLLDHSKLHVLFFMSQHRASMCLATTYMQPTLYRNGNTGKLFS